MNAMIFFLAGMSLAILFSFMTIAAIRKSYREILKDLCGTEPRASFWVRVSEVCLVTITIFSGLVFHNYRLQVHADNVRLFWSFVSQLGFVLAAIFVSLIVISLIVLVNLPQRGGQTEPVNRVARPNHS